MPGLTVRLRSALSLAAVLTTVIPAGVAAQAPAKLVTAVAAPGAPAPVAPEVITRDAQGRATVRALRLTEPLRFDGVLDDPIYTRELPFGGFTQSVPDTGQPSSQRTEAWVLFDDTTLYIVGRCFDTTPPSEWVVSDMRRDTTQLRQNETFGVMLDTFHDRRNGLIFYANPLGARADFAVTDESISNFDWNPVWDARTARFDGGWTIEIAIPFKSIRYQAGTEQTWGIQVRRAIRHRNEWTHLNPVPAANAGSNGISQISLAATLVGLTVPSASRNIEVKPYAISRVTTDNLRTPPVVNDVEPDFGVDLRYGVSANLTADFTYNTDFAQVEADEQQVNLTRFNLIFPEKREFFLEGRGIFDFARGGGDVPVLFYSRRIGLNAGGVTPIDLGARLTGKVGPLSVGLMNLQTGEVDGSPSTNFTVVRLKRDILRRSAVGLIVTNRSIAAGGGEASQAFGADAAFSFFRNVDVGTYWAETRTPGRSGDARSYQGRFDYGGDRYGATADYLHVGADFNPEVGFVRRVAFDRESGSLRFSPRPKTRLTAVRKFTWQADASRHRNPDGVRESSLVAGSFSAEFQTGDTFDVRVNRNYERLVRPFAVARGVTIAPGGYGFTDGRMSYTFGLQRRLSGTASLQQGAFYDGHITTVGLSAARIGFGPRLSFEPSLSLNRAEVSSGSFMTTVVRTRGDFAFTTRMFATGLVQFGSADRGLSTNLRFRWEYLPGSELFAVYTDERDLAPTAPRTLKNRAFVIKINRLLRF